MSFENNYKNRYWVSKYLDLIFRKLQFLEQKVDEGGGGSQDIQQTLLIGNTIVDSTQIIFDEGSNIQTYIGNGNIEVSANDEDDLILIGMNNSSELDDYGILSFSYKGNNSDIIANPNTIGSARFLLPLSLGINVIKTLATTEDMYITKTKSEIDAIITAGLLDPLDGLKSGAMYKITGVHPTLYDDGTTSGTTIFLQALTPTTLAKEGHGEFYNPKYDQSIDGFGIWDAAMALPTIGDKTIWGGYSWTNVNGLAGTSIDILNLDSEWIKDIYTLDDYNKVYDIIEYDYENDWVSRRYEIESGNDITYNFVDYNYMGYNNSAISVFMFGNVFDDSGAGVGIGNNIIYHAYNENINFMGKYQTNLIFNTYSYQDNINFAVNCTQDKLFFGMNSRQSNITFGINSQQEDITFGISSYQEDIIFNNDNTQKNITFIGESYQSNITFANESGQYNLTFNNDSHQDGIIFLTNSRQTSLIFMTGSYQQNITLPISSQMKYITFEPSVNIDSIDYTSALLVFGDYTKTIYKRPDGTNKLRYYNNSDVLVIADLTD